jgi:MATE family multidrug resistance protein
MKRLKAHINAQLSGPGGISNLLQIAFPMVISQASDTVMMFFDRLFLSRLGKEHLAASMSGGLTAFMVMTFFMGVAGYVTTLVAQHYGAGQKRRCSVVITQALIFALLSYPLILLCGWLLQPFFRLFGHSPLQLQLETTYFRILIFGSILGLLRAVLAGFFSGLGRTRIVMVANLTAMLVNLPCNYVLIFGKLGFAPLGMAGAAYGTLIGGGCGCLILCWGYWNRQLQEEYHTRKAWKFEPALLRMLLRYGTPSGLEILLNIAAFNFVVQLFHSYGPDVAAAVTIAFNWDLVSFFPMIGVNIATMSLVGRNIGAGNLPAAERSAYSGFKVAGFYAGLMMVLFLSIPHILVEVFVPQGTSLDYSLVTSLGQKLIVATAFYTLADATALVFGGALRGAGDTTWVMWSSVLIHWSMALLVFCMVRLWNCEPFTSWIAFVLCIVSLGFTFYRRFRRGKWRQIQMLES